MLCDYSAGWRDDIVAGVPLVGLEPGCLSAFRDELISLFPNNELAEKLSRRSFLFSEFLEQANYIPPDIQGEAVVHLHCHHRSIIGINDECSVLGKTGMKVKIPDSGRCGMAGAYGFSPEHVEASRRIGEKALLPAIRQAAPDACIVVHGFSCREQVHQGSERRTLHLAELLAATIKP